MANFKTAESVSPKHPDKICDQISDAILDALLTHDPDARVAIDVAGGHGAVFVTGEVSTQAPDLDIKPIVQRLAGDVKIVEHIAKQSPEIARGVDRGGAGDQGIMVGYAVSETKACLPVEVMMARDLNQYLFTIWPYDGKTQITTLNGKIYTIIASFQHAPKAELTAAVKAWQAQQHSAPSCTKVTYHINPAGDWKQGGFDADAGLTGRKLIVDNYGPTVPIGGGAFSGKDPSKVDRSAAYMARKVAIEYLKRFQAKQVSTFLAYAIGHDQPVQAIALIDGTKKIIEDYDLSPNGIINTLQLKRPIYEQTARYGHFGHADFPWETI